ncbi:MAG: MBL fold metallo-hydrolase [Ignavibacteriales bacterium]|nr:MBL fold metallo-hydrolase [Ignavibacteriales bacterium]
MKRRKFILSTLIAAAGAPILKAAPAKGSEPEVCTPTPSLWKDDDINIAWLGHSTVLMKLFGKFILTDPVLYDTIGVNLMGLVIGPTRYSPMPLERNAIPKPDIVLLSHAHMDHMDTRSLSYLSEKYPGEIDCITAYNTQDVIEDMPWKSLREIDWGQQAFLGDIRFKALQVKHFGWRYPGEKDRSRGYFADGRSYNAYIIEKNGKKILFGGDTAMTDSFAKADEQVDIAIMPIGAYMPWRFNHCNPEEAMQMAASMQAKTFIPIHCNTFRQGMEPVEEPVQRMIANKNSHQMEIGISKIGETFNMV